MAFQLLIFSFCHLQLGSLSLKKVYEGFKAIFFHCHEFYDFLLQSCKTWFLESWEKTSSQTDSQQMRVCSFSHLPLNLVSQVYETIPKPSLEVSIPRSTVSQKPNWGSKDESHVIFSLPYKDRQMAGPRTSIWWDMEVEEILKILLSFSC
jgi:hypothetical protein